MISVVIPTLDSERLLLPTLSSLVPGSARGLIREVLLADGGSRDGTDKIAEAAGCDFLLGAADEGERLRHAAAAARGEWLLFLDPGAVLEEGWPRELARFTARVSAVGEREKAATFRLAIDATGWTARVREATAAVAAVFGVVRPDQGLLIAGEFYREIGGHPPGPHPRRRLLKRIGRRPALLRTRILLPA